MLLGDNSEKCGSRSARFDRQFDTDQFARIPKIVPSPINHGDEHPRARSTECGNFHQPSIQPPGGEGLQSHVTGCHRAGSPSTVDRRDMMVRVRTFWIVFGVKVLRSLAGPSSRITTLNSLYLYLILAGIIISLSPQRQGTLDDGGGRAARYCSNILRP